MSSLEILLYIKIVYTIVMLSYFSILDIKYRDIPDRQVWFSLGVSILLFLASIPLYLSTYRLLFILVHILIALVVGPLVFYILYLRDLIGDADVVIASELAILYPTPEIYNVVLVKTGLEIHIPPIIPMLLYTNLLIIVLIPVIALKNLLLHHNLYSGLKTGFFRKLVLLATSKPVTVSQYLCMKHTYPLEELYVENGVLKRRFKTTFSIQEDYREHQERLRELLEKGYVSRDTVIIVTYGIPYVVPMLLGFLLFLVIGDLLFLPLLS